MAQVASLFRAPMAKEKAEIPVPATNRLQTPQRRSWKRYAAVVAGALLLYTVVPNDWPPMHPRRPPSLPADKAEELFLTVPNAESALAASREYATHPHLAGAPEDFKDAKDILKVFQEELGIPPPYHEPIFPAGSKQSRLSTLGLTSFLRSRRPSAWIDTYYPVLNTPLNLTLQLLDKDENDKVLYDADLVEDGDPADPEAAKYKNAVPAWHGLSFNGSASGQFVYANYATQEDYAELIRKGVDLHGKIIIARYGSIFRGLKIKGAQELGAAGVLIYSDPRDDGYVTEDNGYTPYPYGPARNPTSVQRGSVQYLTLYPGDPTTPGYPAYENAERQEGINIPKIPSLPISWATASHFLSELRDGSEAKDKYPVLNGMISKNIVKLVNHVDTKVTPIWNTMAAIPGHIKDEVVLVGCHRDAWVMGAADPTSGTISLLEIVRGLGALLKAGWRPLRTIVIASWDGEEYGLVGSTEWGEDFPSWIQKHVVSYLNVDVSAMGSQWNVQGSPSLVDLIKRTALEVPHPTEKGKSLWDARNDEGHFKGNKSDGIVTSQGVPTTISQAPDSEIGALGSGSDYTVFLQRLGVASTDQGFGSTASDAVYHYHSIYDSQRWQEVYGDPTFERHVAVAKHLGLLTLRLTDSIILPLNTTRYAFELDLYLDRVEELLSAADLPVSDVDEKPDFSDLRKAIRKLQKASLKLDEEKEEAERKFRELLDKLPPPHGPPHGAPPPHDPPHGPPHHGVHTHRKGPHCHRHGRRLFRRVKLAFYQPYNVFRSLVGLEPVHQPYHHRYTRETPQQLLGRALELAEDRSVDGLGHPSPPPPPDHDPKDPRHPHHSAPHKHSRPHFPIRKFIRAAHRVSRANAKLRSFERGFISEEGIRDRDWYKHLGVAPGKWLGYGATTFPALTEAVTIEKNVTRVEEEAERLRLLIKGLRKSIEV